MDLPLGYPGGERSCYRIRANAIENVRFSTFLAIHERSRPHTEFKCLGKVALLMKADRQCDLCERHIGFFQEVPGRFKTLTKNKLVWALSCCVTKESSKVIGAKPQLLGKHLQREVLIEVSENKVRHASHLGRRQLPASFMNGHIGCRIVSQQMGDKHLGSRLSIELSHRCSSGRMLQLLLQGEGNRSHQGVLKSCVLLDHHTRRIMVRHLLDGSGKEIGA